jgi:sugar lactone lactonase YvrE
VVDSGTGKQRILGGNPDVPGMVDGPSDASRFSYPIGLALSADENTLYVCDQDNNRIRAIDTASGMTRIVAGCDSFDNMDGLGTAAHIYAPHYCVWDRASDVEPFTFLYITAVYAVRRLNVKTGQMTTIKCTVKINPFGIVCLSGSGRIIISCIQTGCLWTIDPRTNTMERIAGALRTGPVSAECHKLEETQTEWNNPLCLQFGALAGIAWYERDQSILVTDRDLHTVFRVPLPDHFFSVPIRSSDD